jgi:hypothetical protein
MTLPWTSCRLDNAAAHVVGGGGGGGSSVWGDHGTNVVLSTTTITNDTAAGTAGSYSAVRGTLAHTATGKYYFEVKVLTAPGSSIVQIGIMDDTTANGAAMDNAPGGTPKSAANTGFNGNHDGNIWNGNDTGAGWSLVDGDVLGYALDLIDPLTGFGYLAKNNVWFLSGDPTSGTSHTGCVASAVLGNARPAMWVFGSVGGLYKLVTAAPFSYSPPSGYVAWG